MVLGEPPPAKGLCVLVIKQFEIQYAREEGGKTDDLPTTTVHSSELWLRRSPLRAI